MTVVGHAIVGVAAHLALRPQRWTAATRGARIAVWLGCVLLPVLPDIDVVAFLVGIPYRSPIGHRGFTHSFAFAALVGWWAMAALRRRGWLRAGDRTRVFAFATALCATHALTDAMTDGGRGVALYSPVSNTRVFFPARFIPVSPFVGVVQSQAALDSWARDARQRVQRPRFAMWLPRAFLSLSDDLAWTRFWFICGVMATEALLSIPLFLLALVAPRLLRTRAGPVDAEMERAAPPAPVPPWPGLAPRRGMWIAIGGSGMALAVACATFHYRNRNVAVERRFLGNKHATPYLLARNTSKRRDASAILVPGSRMASQSLLPLARMLARNGIDAYAVDFPGHGVSDSSTDYACPPEGLKGRRCRTQYWYAMIRDGETAVRSLMERGGLDPDRTVYIGHSIGGTLMDYRLPDKHFRARINLEGRARNLTRGGNHLFVASPAALKYIGIPKSIPRNQLFGSFADRTAYKLRTVIVPHSALVRDDVVNREIIRWITDSFQWGRQTPAYRAYADLSMAQFGLCFLLLAGVLEMASWRLALRMREPAWGRAGSLVALAASAGIARLAVEGLPRAFAWAGHLHGVGALAVVFLMLVGILLSPLMALRSLRPTGRQALGEVAIGLLVFGAFYASVGMLVDQQFFGVRLTLARLPRMALLMTALWPLCYVLARSLRGDPTYSAQPAALLRLSVTWIALLGLFATGVIAALRVEALMLAGLAVAAETLATILYVRLRSPIAAATLVAAMLGWFCSVAYPIVS